MPVSRSYSVCIKRRSINSLFVGLLFVGISAGSQTAIAQTGTIDCADTPAGAVMSLPPPLDEWGEIFCTPYGHVIAARRGWIWSEPGDYSPVFLPSQMVRSNPDQVGNASYFTIITLTRVVGEEFDEAYKTFQVGFDPNEKPPTGFRLNLASVSGRTLLLYFFDYGDFAWGMWCPSGECTADGRFMILDMSKPPQ